MHFFGPKILAVTETIDSGCNNSNIFGSGGHALVLYVLKRARTEEQDVAGGC